MAGHGVPTGSWAHRQLPTVVRANKKVVSTTARLARRLVDHARTLIVEIDQLATESTTHVTQLAARSPEP